MALTSLSLRTILFSSALPNIVSCLPSISYTRAVDSNAISVPGVQNAGEPVLGNFVSFSIEFAFFPDFAGNKSAPNAFSNNLLGNLGELQGGRPDVRVGGNTQDFALFDPNLETATKGIYTNVSNDYPRILSIGPSYFESYETWTDVKFVHGFNLAKNDSEAAASLVNSVPYACKALSHDNFLYWEMGNEPDLFKTSSQGIMRPTSWNESDYVEEWNEKVGWIKEALGKNCAEEWVSDDKFKWIAPSFAGMQNSLDPVKAWKAGLDQSNVIAKFSSHNYIGGATQPGVTLRGTLMNHTKTVSSVSAHIASHANLTASGLKLDYILGETNSLYNQGKPGLSNSFGAALWGVDFNLLCAASNIKQVFMHMGTDYRYASWQPVETNKTTKGTKAPYYGNVAVAAALGDLSKGDVRVAEIPLGEETEAAYAIFADENLKRIMVINMEQYNYSVPEPSARPETTYNFTLPSSCAGSGTLQRLIANGSDAITGVTFNGVSYNYELDDGRPKLLGNVTRDETVTVGKDGGVSVKVPASSAALVQLDC